MEGNASTKQEGRHIQLASMGLTRKEDDSGMQGESKCLLPFSCCSVIVE